MGRQTVAQATGNASPERLSGLAGLLRDGGQSADILKDLFSLDISAGRARLRSQNRQGWKLSRLVNALRRIHAKRRHGNTEPGSFPRLLHAVHAQPTREHDGQQ